MEIPFHSLVDWYIGVILCVFAIGLYLLGHKIQSIRLFSYLSFFVSLWSFSIGVAVLLVQMENIYALNLIVRLSYFIAITIVNIFILFAISYPYESKIKKETLYSIIVSIIIFFSLIFFTDTIISKTIISADKNYPNWNYGLLWFIFDIYFITIFLIGIKILYKKLKQSHDLSITKHLNYMLLVFIIGFIPPLITSLFLPRVGIFNYDWTSPFSSIIWIAIISYAITKHHLFNMRVIAIEIVTFGLWVFVLFRALTAKDISEFYIEAGILLIAIVFGIMLIRTIIHEILQREKIEELTEKLDIAYKEIEELNISIEEKEFSGVSKK